jgi:hypothetical protein
VAKFRIPIPLPIRCTMTTGELVIPESDNYLGTVVIGTVPGVGSLSKDSIHLLHQQGPLASRTLSSHQMHLDQPSETSMSKSRGRPCSHVIRIDAPCGTWPRLIPRWLATWIQKLSNGSRECKKRVHVSFQWYKSA